MSRSDLDGDDGQEAQVIASSWAVPIIYAQVVPLVFDHTQDPPYLVQPLVQHQLEKWTLRSTAARVVGNEEDANSIQTEWVPHQDAKQIMKMGYLYHSRIKRAHDGPLEEAPRIFLFDTTTYYSDNPLVYKTTTYPILWLPSADPLETQPIPCLVRIFTPHQPYLDESLPTRISYSTTLVRIMPWQAAVLAKSIDNENMEGEARIPHQDWFWQHVAQTSLLGERPLESPIPETIQNPDAIQMLSLRLQAMLDRPIAVGTAPDAFDAQRKRLRRKVVWRKLFLEEKETVLDSQTKENEGNFDHLDWESALLVHSPHHGAGKTLLVQKLARKLGCSKIHTITCPTLLAKYGNSADAALESLLHGILLDAAISSAKVCILFDHLDALVPSRGGGGGDPDLAVLNATAIYLKSLTKKLQRTREFPFPTKHTFYGGSIPNGMVLSVHLCLVGVVTCPDDGGRRPTIGSSSHFSSSILESLPGGGTFRLPDLVPSTRIIALQQALDDVGMPQDQLKLALPRVAAACVWARGRDFERIAKQLLGQKAGEGEVTADDLRRAIAVVRGEAWGNAEVEFGASADDSRTNWLDSVGGNSAAKQSLEDALALDPDTRERLLSFGISLPSGILLYGPPGTGKTLLAKAVSRLLRSRYNSEQSTEVLGGAFISLNSSDIVRAEVGTSEKLVSEAFAEARRNAPSVVFIDEFQALFTARSSGGSSKLASTLLQCLDDVKKWSDMNEPLTNDGREGRRVVVLAATNTPWMIERAFLRPGRFDRIVHVGLPTLSERKSILEVLVTPMRLQILNGDSKSDTVRSLCSQVATQTDGYSGADLAALRRAAAIRCLTKHGRDGAVNVDHFLEAAAHDVRPSSDQELVVRLRNWRPGN